MPLSITPDGVLTGARADDLAIALTGSTLSEVFAIVAAGGKIRYHVWSLVPNGFAEAAFIQTTASGSNVAVTGVVHDRLLAAFKASSGGKFRFRAFNEFPGTEPPPSHFAAEAEQDHHVALAGFPEPGHPLAPDSPGLASKSGGAHHPGSMHGAGGIHGPKTNLPKRVKIADKIKVTLAPKVCYAASASVTQDHKLRVGIWAMDWGGQIITKLGHSSSIVNESVIAARIATTGVTWEEKLLRKAEFVTALHTDTTPGPLKLIRWRRDFHAKPPTLLPVGEAAAAGMVKAVELAPVKTASGMAVVTASIDAGGTLQLIGWKLNANGSITRWIDASSPEAVSAVRCAQVRDNIVVTAIRQNDATLKLIYWQFPEDGATAAVRLGEKAVHDIGFALDVVHRPGTGNALGETVVATNTGGNLELARFQVTLD